MIIHKLIPVRARRWLLTKGWVRDVMKRLLAGPRAKPLPGTPYTLHFDGYRNFGLGAVDLAAVEARQLDLAARCLAVLKPRCVWDIGANVGMWTLWLGGHLDSACRVRAFEPDARNVEFLRMNVDTNRLTNVDIRTVALSSSSASKTLTLDDTGSMNSLELREPRPGGPGVVEVQATTVDDEVRITGVAPEFVKMDVEGHELEVLRGASDLLRAGRTVMLMEITAHGEEVMRLLRDAGYRVHDLDGREITAAEYYVLAVPSSMRVASSFWDLPR